MRSSLVLSLVYYLLFSGFAFGAGQPAIQLASQYRENIQVSDYWVSEKLDGVRAYWDGKQLISRRGKVFAAPGWFTVNFPQTHLDGELWIGRGHFDLVSGIVRQQRKNNPAWRQLRFMIFDMPQSSQTFSERVSQMRQLVAKANSPYLAIIQQQKLATRAELDILLDRVVAAGGEGLMLHHGNALYMTARSQDLMKLKQHQDAEAIVLAHLPGKGRLQGKMGAILVETVDGVQFKIGSGFSDAQRSEPPPIGATVTYKYYGKTGNNKPRFASFIRVRFYP